MTGSVDLNPNHLAIVEGILAEHVPECEVRAFGSRATWTSRDYSDLDLAIVGEGKLHWRTLARLKEAFEESRLPMRVDVLDWHAIPESFRKVIEAENIVVQERGHRGTAPVEDEWIHCTLADACSAVNYGLTASASSTSDGPKFLRITDIVSGQIDWNSVPHVDASDEILAKYRLSDGDIVIARTGASTGKSTYVKNPPPSVFASYLVRLRAKPEFNARFIAYFLKSSEFGMYIHGVFGDKSAQPNASASTMTAAPLRIPSNKEEQRAIGHVLGTLDDKIELNRRMNETLEEMARTLFKSWFVDFDPVRAKMEGRWRRGESMPGLPADLYDLFPNRLEDSELGQIPEGWEVKTLGEVAETYDSMRIPLNSRQRAERQGTYPYYGAAGIMDYVDDYLFNGVYVLLGEDGSVVDDEGYPVVQYVWGQFWVNNHAHVLRSRRGISLEHLYLFLKQVNIVPYVTGAVQPKLSQTNLNAVEFLLPPPPVCDAFASQISSLFQQIRKQSNESHTLATQRDALLPRLVSGGVRVQSNGEM